MDVIECKRYYPEFRLIIIPQRNIQCGTAPNTSCISSFLSSISSLFDVNFTNYYE